MFACMEGRLDTFNVLFEFNKDKKEASQGVNSDILEAKDSLGKNCFHYAVGSKSTDLVKCLLEKRKDFVYDKDSAGYTALHFVVWNIFKN